jgi:hypothetical protein
MSFLYVQSRVMHMDENDNFTNQIRELVVLEEHMEQDVDWKDCETITSMVIGVDKIMNNDGLDVMMDPSHELRQSKEDEIKEVYRKEEEECLHMYGKDERIQQMICNETSDDLDRCMKRLERGDLIHEQVEVMNGLRKAKKFYEARMVCVWIFAQNGKYGVWYDEDLLKILKDFLGDVNDQVAILKESCLKLHLTFK